MSCANHAFMDPEEIAFVAQNELVTILPRVSTPAILLVGPSLPALTAMRRVEVPLWLALILRGQDKCQIVVPEWLTLALLQSKYTEELENPLRFSLLPWHWLETSKAILAEASEDLVDAPHAVRLVLQDLREVRWAKSRRGLRELNEVYLQLDGLSWMEINEMRGLVVGVMAKMKELGDTLKE